MEILTDYKDLVGKEIAFSHMAQFAEQITIATKCGCVLMAEMDFDDYEDSSNIRILHKRKVISIIEGNKWMREELGELGIFDIEAYEEKEKIREEEERKARLLRREKKEREEYERLKKKARELNWD